MPTAGSIDPAVNFVVYAKIINDSISKTFISVLLQLCYQIWGKCDQTPALTVCIFHRFEVNYTIIVKSDSLTTQFSVKNLNGR